MSATTEGTQEPQDAHFMELALSTVLLRHHADRLASGGLRGPGNGCAHLQAAARGRPDGSGGLVNAQPDWSKLQVVGDFMRDRALRIIAAFPWAQARTRTAVEGSS